MSLHNDMRDGTAGGSSNYKYIFIFEILKGMKQTLIDSKQKIDSNILVEGLLHTLLINRQITWTESQQKAESDFT